MPSALKLFETRTISDSLTRPANTTQYTAGDVISAVTTNDHFTFDEVVRERSGVILGAILNSSQNNATLKLDAELWLFRTDIAEVADNSAFAPTDAEMLTCVGVIDFDIWTVGTATSGAGGNARSQVNDLNIVFTDDGSSRKLYGQLVARNAYDPVSSEVLTVDLIIGQD